MHQVGNGLRAFADLLCHCISSSKPLRASLPAISQEPNQMFFRESFPHQLIYR